MVDVRTAAVNAVGDNARALAGSRARNAVVPGQSATACTSVSALPHKTHGKHTRALAVIPNHWWPHRRRDHADRAQPGQLGSVCKGTRAADA